MPRRLLEIVPLEEAVGLPLAHDITEIRPGKFKGPAFRKGHIVRPEDLEHLRRLGKEHLYVLRLTKAYVHEDEAAGLLAKALCGPGVAPEAEPKEGKLNLLASRDGLLEVDKEALLALNMLGEVMCATLQSHILVRKGQQVGATRAIPLMIKRSLLQKALKACPAEGVLRVLPLKRMKAAVLITGTEVYEGRIKDAFGPLMRRKLRALGAELLRTEYAPDQATFIRDRLRGFLQEGAELLLCTGGMSVDPDDVTRHAVRLLGATEMYYGSPVLPGAMFLVAYVQGAVLLGVPACGMYHKRTVLDLLLPRIMAGKPIDRAALAELGHGGLCWGCRRCRFPVCPFGKG
jgi:molybdopterin biosynthesis enzyme